MFEWDEAHSNQAEEAGLGRRLREFWRVIWKYKWAILTAAAVSLAFGQAMTILTPKIYTASATIEIDRQVNDYIKGSENSSDYDDSRFDDEFFQTQYGLLKSRSLALRVAQTPGLTSDPAFLKAMGARKPPLAAILQKGWGVGFLEGGLGVLPVRDSRLVLITFNSPDPVLSARVANAFADNFIRANLQRRFDASDYARQFLEDRLADLKAKLENSERQLVAYATREQIIQVNRSSSDKDASPPQPLDTINLGGADDALNVAQTNMLLARQRWHGTQAAPGLAAPDILSDPTVQQLRGQRATLQTRYNELRKTFTPEYPEMQQLKSQIDDLDAQLAVAANTVRASLKTQADTAAQQASALQDRVNRLRNSALDERGREIEYNILQREVDTTRSLYEGLLQRYRELDVLGGATTNNVSIVDSAEPPGGPSQPDRAHNLLKAGAFGLTLGLALAFLLETLDLSLRDPIDVEAKLGLAVLGAVPLLEKETEPLEALSDVRSPFSEAHNSIRTSLSFALKAGARKVLAVVSTLPGEGKSTTALCLSRGFARVGARTLLVDLDLRNPSLHNTIGADNRVGASSLLTDAAHLQGAVQPTEWPNLFFVPSGPLPVSPAELLESPRLPALVREATEHFDVVILDGPPVMGLADTLLIASVATGTILAVEAGRTNRTEARAAIKWLRRANAFLCGVVLTKFDPRKTASVYGYTYAYEYEYEQEAEPDAGPAAITGRWSLVTHDRSRKARPAA